LERGAGKEEGGGESTLERENSPERGCREGKCLLGWIGGINSKSQWDR